MKGARGIQSETSEQTPDSVSGTTLLPSHLHRQSHATRSRKHTNWEPLRLDFNPEGRHTSTLRGGGMDGGWS